MTEDEIIAGMVQRVRDGRPIGDRSGTVVDNSDEVDPPVPVGELEAFERGLGFTLPALLRRIYLEVANGCVGPGFSGVLALPGGPERGDYPFLGEWEDLATHSEPEPLDPPPIPRGVLFLADWGCATWSLIDCRTPQGRMWWWDSGDRWVLDLTLAQWLELWLTGTAGDVGGVIDGHPEQWVRHEQGAGAG